MKEKYSRHSSREIMPKVSVIMAVHNSEEFLEESIKSILNQSLQEFELIIIDDVSTDGSLEIANKYRERDERIIIIKNKRNLGPAGTRNSGLKNAQGKYVAILDSDDLSHPRRLEVEYAFLENNPDIFLVGASAVFIDETGKPLKRFRKYSDSNLLSWRLPKSCSIIHSSIMFRNNSSLFYNEEYKYAHDYALYLEALSQGKKLINLPYFLTKYRVSNKSISVSKRKEQESFRNLIQERYSFLRKNKFSFFKKIYFSIFLLGFYLSTIREKRGL